MRFALIKSAFIVASVFAVRGSRASYSRYIFLGIWDIYNTQDDIFSYFPGIYTICTTRLRRFVSLILSACSPAPCFSLHLLPAFPTSASSTFPRRLLHAFALFSLPSISLPSCARSRFLPTILPPVSVIIEFALCLGYRARSRGRRRSARSWTFRIWNWEEEKNVYKRREEESAAVGKWPRIVPLAVAAIRLDGSAVRSADCEKLPFDFET